MSLFTSEEILERLARHRAEVGPELARADTNLALVILGATAYGRYHKGVDFAMHPVTIAMDHTKSTTKRNIAFLHHVVGEGDWTVQQLERAGFTSRVVGGVDDITRGKGEPYYDFVERCGANRDARPVKIKDMTPNTPLQMKGFSKDPLHKLAYTYLLSIQQDKTEPRTRIRDFAKTNPTRLSRTRLRKLLNDNSSRRGSLKDVFIAAAEYAPDSAKNIHEGRNIPFFTKDEIIARVQMMPEPMARENLAIFILGCASFGARVRSGEDYALHPLIVGMSEQQFSSTRVMGFLHDVVEDSDWTLDDLRKVGFSERDVSGVNALTRRKKEGEPYYDFIERCSKHRDAIDLKIADMEHNMNTSRPFGLPTEKDLARDRKYKIAHAYLIAIKQGEIEAGSSIVAFAQARRDEFDPAIANPMLLKHSSHHVEILQAAKPAAEMQFGTEMTALSRLMSKPRS